MSIALTKYGLNELIEQLSDAEPCLIHGADDNMVICPSCFKVRCRLCDDTFCDEGCGEPKPEPTEEYSYGLRPVLIVPDESFPIEKSGCSGKEGQ